MTKNQTLEEFISALTENLTVEELFSADIISNISNEIAKRRIALGLSQSELAKKLGRSQGTISKWENGDMDFTVSTLADIAVKMDMDLTVELKKKDDIQEWCNCRYLKSNHTDHFHGIKYSCPDNSKLQVFQM